MQSYNSLCEDEEGLLLHLIDFGPQGWIQKKKTKKKNLAFNLSKLIYKVWISNNVKIHPAILTSHEVQSRGIGMNYWSLCVRVSVILKHVKLYKNKHKVELVYVKRSKHHYSWSVISLVEKTKQNMFVDSVKLKFTLY